MHSECDAEVEVTQKTGVASRAKSTAEESASLIVYGREFQSLGVEFENALKPKCCLVCFYDSIYRVACKDSLLLSGEKKYTIIVNLL